MLRFVPLILLMSTKINCIPIDSTKSEPTLNRPSPINPEVLGDPKPKESIDSNVLSSAKKNPALKYDQQNNISKRLSTTTVEPVSLKTPIVHPSGAKTKRSTDESSTKSSTSRPTSTRAPFISSSNDDYDNSGPHFVRPVPVAEILKNLHEAPRQTHAPTLFLHQGNTAAEATTDTSTSTTVSAQHNDHKANGKTPESEEAEKDDQSS
ncbi:uncharacterized protein LOC129724365 [Wyeomyia smithii]|uniref:uncharacterized protein LOC129724365 n=1 Tax=Wyeomyia smithii TaxID=174621 RepID=UPI002467D8B6|nr:uncharacterized protein LOC129724365 [Wyeomyia smithii]